MGNHYAQEVEASQVTHGSRLARESEHIDVEQTNIAKGNGTTGIATANGGDMTTWTNAKSDWMFFFGNDTVAEAIAVPEEMRGKIPTDYGRSKGVAWYYLGGFGIVHTLASKARIVKWASAA